MLGLYTARQEGGKMIEFYTGGEVTDVVTQVADCLAYLQIEPDDDHHPAADAGRICILGCLEMALRQVVTRLGSRA